MFVDTDRLAGAVPLAGVTASQVWLSDAVKLSVPRPCSRRSPSARPGSPHPVAVNARSWATDSTGVAGFTVRVTATVFGEPDAPAAVTVTVPV